jgi:hypothetical protein
MHQKLLDRRGDVPRRQRQHVRVVLEQNRMCRGDGSRSGIDGRSIESWSRAPPTINVLAVMRESQSDSPKSADVVTRSKCATTAGSFMRSRSDPRRSHSTAPINARRQRLRNSLMNGRAIAAIPAATQLLWLRDSLDVPVPAEVLQAVDERAARAGLRERAIVLRGLNADRVSLWRRVTRFGVR